MNYRYHLEVYEPYYSPPACFICQLRVAKRSCAFFLSTCISLNIVYLVLMYRQYILHIINCIIILFKHTTHDAALFIIGIILIFSLEFSRRISEIHRLLDSSVRFLYMSRILLYQGNTVEKSHWASGQET